MESSFFSNRKPKADLESDLFAQVLLLTNRDLFFTTLYNAIINHPTYVVVSDIPLTRKVEIINEMISYYERREDYEKCANLMKVKKEVEIC